LKLIVGLGNPGKKYESTRHNIGFMVVDYLVGPTIKFQRHKSLFYYIKDTIGDEQVFFVKPTTFMNLSGDAVSWLMNYYKIDLDDLLIIYDDLNLEFGKIRLRRAGSAGGHNGMKSIIQKIGSQNFARLKIGIGKPSHPAIEISDFVLMPFSKSEKKEIPQILDNVGGCVRSVIINPIEQAMNEYN